MSYVLGGPLQEAVFAALASDAGLAELVADRIHDAPPDTAGRFSDAPYVTLGDEVVRDRSSKSHVGAQHDFEISVHSADQGYARAKAIATRICEILDDGDLALNRGHLVLMRLLQVRARRGRTPERRRIDLRFRAIVSDDNS